VPTFRRDVRQADVGRERWKDVIIYAVNSYILQQELPNAQLILYPDSAHGSQYQYPKLFVWNVSTFLDG
jgi:hypothetical protein